MELTKEQQLVHDLLQNNLPFFCKKALSVKNKDGNLVPFIFNQAQLYMHNRLEDQKKRTGKVRAIIVKGRQLGISTAVAARFFHQATRSQGKNVFILAHESGSSIKLFDMVKRFHDYMPKALKPKLKSCNSRGLIFKDLDSQYFVGTAGNADVGRGGCVNLLHGCVAYDSKVILANGLSKEIQDMEIGDRVITSSGAIADVSDVIFTGVKQTYKLENCLTNEYIEVTEDHKILTQDGYKELKDLTLNDYIRQATVKSYTPIIKRHFKLEEPTNTLKGQKVAFDEDDIELDDVAGFYFGYYLSDGYVGKQSPFNELSKERHNYMCVYHPLEDQTNVAILEKFIKRYCTSQRWLVRGDRMRYTYYGTFLAELTTSWFGRSKNKFIPPWVFDAPKEFIEGLIKGFDEATKCRIKGKKKKMTPKIKGIYRQLKRLLESTTGDCYNFNSYDNSLDYNMMSDISSATQIWKKINGDIYAKVKSITLADEKETFDIEVDHPDHNFETPIGIISNSEVSFWNNFQSMRTGLMQSVPKSAGTELLLESTSNGMSNAFYEMTMEALKGEGEYEVIFIPYFWMDEYEEKPSENFVRTPEEDEIANIHFRGYPKEKQDAKLAWRRTVMSELGSESRFKQEYPHTVMESFQTSGDTLVKPADIMRARASTITDPNAPVVIGLDPARSGDRSCIMVRRGREILNYYVYKEMDSMSLSGIMATMIEKYNPILVTTDVACGYGIMDSLIEKGYNNVHGIHFSARAPEPDLYKNIRAYMWCKMAEWLKGDVSIPDDDEFQSDLMSVPDYKQTSDGTIRLISKDEIRKIHKRSPDIGDSLALTFAIPYNVKVKPIKFKKANDGLSKWD